MKKRISLLILVISIFVFFLTGCWNYREVDKLLIVGGVAFDKGEEDHYEITVEAIQISGGKDAKMKPIILTAEGKTIFDTARNMVSIYGIKLFWSHAKLVILSKEIASEGVSKVLDMYTRDAETREDVPIIISEADTAKEILITDASTGEITGIMLGDIAQNQKSLAKIMSMDVLQYDIEAQTKGASIVIPTVMLKQENGKNMPRIMGSAIIKNDKLIGFLSGDETKYLNFIRDEIKGGILNEEIHNNDETTLIALEIFNNRTKITPRATAEGVSININTETTVALGEMHDSGLTVNEEETKRIEQSAEAALKAQIEALVKKMQTEYEADIFGFSAKLWEDKPAVFKSVSGNWDEVFKDLQVNVHTKVHVENSATLSKGVGEEA